MHINIVSKVCDSKAILMNPGQITLEHHMHGDEFVQRNVNIIVNVQTHEILYSINSKY